MDCIPFDIWRHHIFPLLSANDLLSLLQSCKTIYSYYLNFQSTTISPLHRNLRLNRWRKRTDEFKVVLDRMYDIQLYDSYFTVILIKIQVPEYLKAHVEVVIHYTHNRWKTVEYAKAKCTKGKYWYVEIYDDMYDEYIDKIWFAIYAKCGDSIVWDNNEGWNYEINPKYHWLPFFYDDTKYCYFKYSEPYDAVVPAIKVWENCKSKMYLGEKDCYLTVDDEQAY